MKVRLKRRALQLSLQDLEKEEPEVIPLKVPGGLRVNGTSYIFRTKPYAHQMAALRRAWVLGNSALFMEQGTGKTAVAIHFAALKFLEGDCDKVLIICPLSTVGVWVKEFRKHLPDDLRRRTKICRLLGTRSRRIKKLVNATGFHREGGFSGKELRFYIINYESAWRLAAELRELDPDIIIADESHRIKSARAKQSKGMWRLGRAARYRLILAGTPIIGGAYDVWSQFNFLNPDVFGDNWWRFRSFYMQMGGYYNKEVIGYKHLDNLKRKVRGNSFIIRKEECLDLPKKVYQVVPIDLSQSSRQLYNDMATQLVAEIEDGSISTAPIVLVKLLRLAQITSGFLKDLDDNIHDVGREKLDTCVELIEDRVGDGHQIVVFARFRHEIFRLEKELLRRKISCCTLTGSTPVASRDLLIEQFQSGAYDVFIAQIQAGSLGITLTSADTAIFLSMDFALGNYLQAQDRLHRIGQTRKVTYLHLIVPGSIDALVYKILHKKKKLAEFILKRPRAVLLSR